jgi:hypothetical protein
MKDAANEQEDAAMAKMSEILDLRPIRLAPSPEETVGF